ncbi:hypothetical protein F511_26113 [Dorcoceras hygrometricum]|uniref:Uncharacterized protein n=1 Tax=Dorcoceras hygrometricum TaxID=472368 RepID=A0A2Z7DAS7_9LAMI|nr:hypothetical protein F511_26113 [Dorcoceras hygrometricum]
MLRLVPAGGIVCVYLLVVQQKQMSTRLAAGIARKSYRLDDVSGATSFELVATLRFEVATGTSREKCYACFVLATGYPAAGSEDCVSVRRRLNKLARRRFENQPLYLRTWELGEGYFLCVDWLDSCYLLVWDLCAGTSRWLPFLLLLVADSRPLFLKPSLLFTMPPRRRGRDRGLFQESGGQNEDQSSAPSRTRESSEEEEIAATAPPVERMDVVIARFQRMNPPVFNGDESRKEADSWLHNVVHLFDRAQYDDELRLRLVTLLLRKAAERWWRGASSTLLETGVGITWGTFSGGCVRVSAGCSAGVDVNAGQLSYSSKRMRRRFVVATGSPAATVSFPAKEREVAAVRVLRRFGRATFWFSVTNVSQLVVEITQLVVPQMPPRRRGRSRGLFQESGGQNEDQYSAPSHTLESSGEEEAAAPPAPMPPRRRGRSRGLFQESGGQNEDQYSAPSHTLESSGEEEAAAPPAPQQQVAQLSGRKRFRPRGHQFKKKSGSGSSGSGSSSSSGSRAEFCGFCGGKNSST